MIKIDNLTINVNKVSLDNMEETLDSPIPAVARDELVSTLRIISEDTRFEGQTVIIPDQCEQYGFAEGEYKLPELLEFLADMLE